MPFSARPADKHAASFEAVRRQVFAELEAQARRWVWLFAIPINVALTALFVLTGGPPLRGLVMLVALPLGHAPMLLRRGSGEVSVIPFVWSALHYFTVLAITGGVASPILPMGLPVVASAVLVLTDRRAKIGFVAAVACGFGALAVLSTTKLGATPPPFGDARGAPTLAYAITVAFGSAFAVVSFLRTGMYVTAAYARIAQELAARRDEVYEEGTELSRALEGMAARVAHEVKNPLAAIKALSSHVARSSPDAKTAERLGIVASEADRLQGIVDGFLSFSRGLGELRLERTKPWEVARELSVLLEPRLAEQGLTMEVIGDEKIEVLADGRKLRQVLLNLVLNAMHASPRGHIITVAVVFSRDDVVRVRVIDRGEGMSADVVERIRKPYFSTREGGTGLGVAIARALVEQHGGALRFESVAGQGTTVTLELPPTAAPPAREALPQPRAASATVGSDAKVVG